MADTTTGTPVPTKRAVLQTFRTKSVTARAWQFTGPDSVPDGWGCEPFMMRQREWTLRHRDGRRLGPVMIGFWITDAGVAFSEERFAKEFELPTKQAEHIKIIIADNGAVSAQCMGCGRFTSGFADLKYAQATFDRFVNDHESCARILNAPSITQWLAAREPREG